MREQYSYSWLQRAAMAVLGAGELPRHVAFIMDGNRRFAKSRGEATIEGHRGGFHTLAETLQWCRRLGVQEVTVYAFSIENFRRGEDEVTALLQLAKEKFQGLISEEEKLRRHGVRVRILGNKRLLPQDIREVLEKAEEITKDNCQCLLNVAFAYTAREEITSAVRKAAELVQCGSMKPEDISESSLGALLYTGDSPPVDLLIRTSGETRLSDFLLWQASTAVLYFTQVLWPDFSLWHLLGGIFYYQRHHQALSSLLQHQPQTQASVLEVVELDTSVAALLGSLAVKKGQ